MGTYLLSMAVIAIVAILAPIAASLIPNKPIPEVVFLLVAGAILGPNMMGIIQTDGPIVLFNELGLAFLFLLAGYEIDPHELKSERGKAALATWFVSFALAALVVTFVTDSDIKSKGGIAIVIAMTSTAIGTLLPILKERGLMDTSIGKTVLAHGTFGEIMPVLAMAILMSVRSTWETIIILILFLVIAVATAVFPKKAENVGAFLSDFLNKNADTTSQTTMRATVALLVGLVTVASLFQLDIVLGAFAAGFILRYMAPDENRELEEKLDGIAYGFFIPLFFVVSGAGIDLTAVKEAPLLLIGFVGALLLVRAVPVFISTYIPKEDRENMTIRYRITSALYSTTALPIIVAVTHLAVSVDAMSEQSASILVSAGAITVLVIPILTSITCNIADAHPLEAAQEIASDPAQAWSVLREHWSQARQTDKEYRSLRKQVASSDIMRERAKNQARIERERQRLAMLHQGSGASAAGAGAGAGAADGAGADGTADAAAGSARAASAAGNIPAHNMFPPVNVVNGDLEQYEHMVTGAATEQLRGFIAARDKFLENIMRERRALFRNKRGFTAGEEHKPLKDMTWPELREIGDKRWAHIKEEGDDVWESMKEQGDRRWEIVKAQGDRDWKRKQSRLARQEMKEEKEKEKAQKQSKNGKNSGSAEGADKNGAADGAAEMTVEERQAEWSERSANRESLPELTEQRNAEREMARREREFVKEELESKIERPVIERPKVERPEVDRDAVRQELENTYRNKDEDADAAAADAAAENDGSNQPQ